MERVKIHLPDLFTFSTIITVRITDLNYGGHVGNDTFLSLIHEAREQFLMGVGYKELSFAGYGLIVADAAIEYKKELHYGESVKISVAAASADKYGFDLFYKLESISATETTIAAKAKTGMLCYDYKNRKLVPLPSQARTKLTGDI